MIEWDKTRKRILSEENPFMTDKKALFEIGKNAAKNKVERNPTNKKVWLEGYDSYKKVKIKKK